LEAWPVLPKDVIAWFRSAFYRANRSTTERLLNVPNIRETSLDDGLIEALIPHSAPHRLPSGTVVEMQIHNIGGLRRMGSWETADIAVLVFVYRRGILVAQKIGLLQSKRLYPHNGDVDDNDPVGFRYGLNGMLRRDPGSVLGKLDRVFRFDSDCEYGAIKAGDAQPSIIADLNAKFEEAVYYLFYNPPALPTEVCYPLKGYLKAPRPPLGCRVYRAPEIDAVLATLKNGQSPTIGQLEAKTESDWRLEHWAADLLLRCKVGQRIGGNREELVGRLIERRSGPIGAAIAVSIDLDEK
jgi:hypothetical protein